MGRLSITRGRVLLGGALVALVALAATMAISSGEESEANQAEEIEDVVTSVSRNTTQGYLSDDVPIEELDRRYEAGERLFISCGTIVGLARRQLEERGVESRLVATLTRRKFNGLDDGHTLFEVRADDGWVLYDLSTNRVAVGPDGEPLSLVEQLRAGRERRWRELSDDKLIDLRGTGPRFHRYMEEAFVKAGVDSWHDRVLGVPLIEDPPGSGRFVFHDRAQEQRLEAYSQSYEWVDAAAWARLTGEA